MGSAVEWVLYALFCTMSIKLFHSFEYRKIPLVRGEGVLCIIVQFQRVDYKIYVHWFLSFQTSPPHFEFVTAPTKTCRMHIFRIIFEFSFGTFRKNIDSTPRRPAHTNGLRSEMGARAFCTLGQKFSGNQATALMERNNWHDKPGWLPTGVGDLPRHPNRYQASSNSKTASNEY